MYVMLSQHYTHDSGLALIRHSLFACAGLVDFEFAVRARAAAHDLAYFFLLWGDSLWLAGFKPSIELPVPYAALEARRAFVRAYAQLSDEVEVDEFLFQVERAGIAQRAHIMCIWLLLACGDAQHMLASAFRSTVPMLPIAHAVLERAVGGDASARAEIVEFGVMTTAVRHAAAAWAAADKQ
jgi:hypothetical protein